MKKRCLTALVVAMACLGRAHAYDAKTDMGRTVLYKISVAAGVSTAAVVIDLSNNTSWPHRRSNEIYIQSARLMVDKLAASTCTVKLGVVNFVNASTGSVTWFKELPSARNASNTNFFDPPYTEVYYDALVQRASTNDTDGATPYILSNDKTSGSTIYQNDVILPSPLTTGTIPAVGDIVLSVVNSDSSNAIDVYAEVIYFAE